MSDPPGGQKSPPPGRPVEEEEEEEDPSTAQDRRTLQALETYAAACANDAILARKAADDAAFAFRTGAALDPHTVLEVQRKRPGGGVTTPAVISTGSARIVITTEHSNAGLRAAGGYYSHYAEKIDAAAKEVTATSRRIQPMHRYGTRAKKSTSGTATAQPSASGAGAAEPSTSGAGAAKPSTSGAGAAKPSTSGAAAAKPSTSGAAAADPSTSGAAGAKPSTSGAGTASEAGTPRTPQVTVPKKAGKSGQQARC